MLSNLGTAEMTAIEVDERIRSSDLFPRGRASHQQQRQAVQWMRKEQSADAMRLIFLSLPLSPSARPISAYSTSLLTSLASKMLTHHPDSLFTLQNLHLLDPSFTSFAIIPPSLSPPAARPNSFCLEEDRGGSKRAVTSPHFLPLDPLPTAPTMSRLVD
ncbi:hypothetical protein BLNAU_22559 [Blattamonas nauphoetae]|uniref:Uncharacterized protein n=1 Tax=Blattamonas nauphoetae TaxID=2049346 RepID=A0ABQ9WSR1_9EUKA|nr:hypothetical protein BLNAU_22559 [Blattamonas nauphoetae]